jgi:hypothetical protein
VAELYGEVIAEHWNRLGDFDWSLVNHAIMERWSVSGLNYIKREAWKIAETIKRQEASSGAAKKENA